MQERVAVVESILHHRARHSFSSLFRYNVPNVTERSEMKAGRLTDGVDVFLERESVIQNDTQSPKLLTLSDVSAVTSPRSTEVT